MPVQMEALNNISRGFDTTVLRIFKTLTGMLKEPVAFRVFNLEISFSTSKAVIG